MSDKKDKQQSNSSVDDALLDELFRSAATDAAIIDGRRPGVLTERQEEPDANRNLLEKDSEMDQLRQQLVSEVQLNESLKVRIDELQAETDSLRAELEAIKKK